MTEEKSDIIAAKPDRRGIFDACQEMIKSYRELPSGAMLTPVTHYDLISVLLLLSASLRVGLDEPLEH
jgi:hypothetical protein